MTRKSERELERAVDNLDSGGGDEPADVWIAYLTADGWVDGDGVPVPEDATVLVRAGGVAMERSRAEREGYEILGAADTPDGDHVMVPYDYGDREVW